MKLNEFEKKKIKGGVIWIKKKIVGNNEI